ncbi:hypothetical protein KIN20_033299 [Parelaphostrongylus tenuis]|uniref:Uncharacterized protein n=1 Tax=Parelaphostrongylus tenuis TaxID=148309 RepID=A0AAD5R8A9_PARTN|nr:hypothetical protein KIN20_033299 [Parelaphostrongylus tenuis]
MFDSAFPESAMRSVVKHESLSIALLRRLVGRAEIQATLEDYLGTGEEFQNNITFIEELISSKKFDSSGTWLPKGRSIEKAFLFDIVANDNDSIDVDKFDYLIRDSICAGVPIPFGKSNLERLMENARVLPDPRRGFPRICYAKKVADIILFVCESRQILHNLVYQHRVVVVIQAMLIKALMLADAHLHYMGDDGVPYSLSAVTQNLEAFLKTSDAILRDITISTSPGMLKAQEILRNIESRNIPKKLEHVECGPSYVAPLNLMNGGSNKGLDELQRCVSQELAKTIGEDFQEESVMILAREIHRGLDGRSHPMTRVLLYDNKSNGDVVARYVDEEWLRLKVPEEAAIWSIGLYVDRSLSNKQRSQLCEAFNLVVTRSGFRMPNIQRRSLSP